MQRGIGLRLIITDLIAGCRASRILIVTPAGLLLDQWREEVAERFGLRLVVADRAELERIRKGAELGTNPFDHLPLALGSMDYLKQDRVRDWLDRFQSLATEAVEEADARRTRIRTLKAIQRKAAKFGILTPAEEEERELMEVEDLAQQISFLTREERSRRREADQAEGLAGRLTRVVDLAGRSLEADPGCYLEQGLWKMPCNRAFRLGVVGVGKELPGAGIVEDALQPLAKEFHAAYDLDILNAPT